MDVLASIPVPAALRGRETGNLYAKCGMAASADGALSSVEPQTRPSGMPRNRT